MTSGTIAQTGGALASETELQTAARIAELEHQLQTERRQAAEREVAYRNKVIVLLTHIEDTIASAKYWLVDGNSENTPSVRARPGLSDWVNCPVCDEPDMNKITDTEGNSLIYCVNHCCPSNGGPAQG